MKRWDAWVNHAGLGLVSVSGLLYGFLKYFATSGDPDSRLGHPWQPTLLAVHLLAAPLAVLGVGLMLRGHALARLTAGKREGRRTGSAVLLFSLPVIFSGYVLQVLTGEAARRWTGWLHAALGLVFAIGFALHLLRLRSLPDDAPEAASEADDSV